MIGFPDTKEKLKNRISDYKSALDTENKMHGCIRDFGGKRYLLFWLYFVLNVLEKSNEYFEWYKKEFPKDPGEAIQQLCWAVSLFRLNREGEARHMLAESMLSNLYIIPYVLGLKVEPYNMWHVTDAQEPDYVEIFPSEVLNALTKEDITWIYERYDSFSFRRIIIIHVGIYEDYLKIKDPDVRKIMLKETKYLLDDLKNNND